jgi:hypothetical protein
MGDCIPVSSGAARRSNCVLVLAYVRIAKSYSPSLRKQCHLTVSHAYSATGRNALMHCFLMGAVLRAYTRRRSISLEMSCRSAPCWPYSKKIETHLGNNYAVRPVQPEQYAASVFDWKRPCRSKWARRSAQRAEGLQLRRIGFGRAHPTSNSGCSGWTSGHRKCHVGCQRRQLPCERRCKWAGRFNRRQRARV